MYRSVGCAIAAMVRYQERQRSPRGTPWPDRPPPGASTADRWRYIRCRASLPGIQIESDDDRDPLTVLLLFARYDKRRALTSLYLEGLRIKDLPGQDRRRAREMRGKFVRELCRRGLLLEPPKSCSRNAHGKYCSRAGGCRMA